MPRISYAERSRIFGAPCTESNLATITTPWGIKVRIHKLLVPVFMEACKRAALLPWRPQRIDSYACRTVRGSTSPSIHGYGLAFDFFATPPNVVPPGGVWTPDNPVPPDFARCFTELGFTWGAEFSRVDLPHLEWAGARPSLQPTPATPVVIPPQPVRRIDSLEIDVVVNVYEVVFTTDQNGSGWDKVPYPRNRIIGYTGPGIRPDADGRYQTGEVGFAEEDGGTVVSLTKWAPASPAVVTLTILN